jgi:hypothetical protein
MHQWEEGMIVLEETALCQLQNLDGVEVGFTD